MDVELQTYFDQPQLSDVNPITFLAERKETQLSTLALQYCQFSTSGATLLKGRYHSVSTKIKKLEKLDFIK